jgi:hypothetical protein
MKFTVVIFLGLMGSLMAQRMVKVDRAIGVVDFHQDITMSAAKEKALQEAKLNALRQAGVGENISENSLLFQHLSAEKADALFSSLISNQINGEIAGFEILSEGLQTIMDRPSYEVVIRAEVKVYDKEEASGIQLELGGLRDQYFDQEGLQFSVLPNRAGYLQAFVVSEAEVYQVYPNAYEKGVLLEGGQKVGFPVNKTLDYILETTKAEAIHYLVLVYTLQPVSIATPANLNELLSRISGIPRSQKTVSWHSFLVRKGR